MGKQKRKRRRAIYSPHISAGVISIDKLKELVDIMKAEGAKNVKLGGETIFVWDQPELPAGLAEKVDFEPNDFRFGGVRPVKMCSAETFCERFQRPVLDLALEIDERFHNTAIEMKMMIGVAGCQRSCSEPSTKDIGVIAHPQGYEILVGGTAGMRPQVGRTLAVVPTADDVLDVLGRIINYCKKYGKKSARLGRIINKRGIDEFKKEIFVNSDSKTGTGEVKKSAI